MFIGPYMTLAAVWNIADIFNGLMAIPNLIALVLLSGVVVRETRDYFRRYPKYRDTDEEASPEEEGAGACLFDGEKPEEGEDMPAEKTEKSENAN